MLDSAYKITAIASVGFNLMFIGGYTWKSFIAPTPDPSPIQQPAEPVIVDDLNLNLDDSQKQALTTAQSEHADEMREAMQAMYLAQQSLWTEMAQAEPDQERIQTLQSEVRDTHQRMRELRSEQFNSFVKTLSPEQRQAIADRSKTHYSKKMKHFHGRLLERFDHNKDGRLDEQERREAREYLHEKKRDYHIKRKKHHHDNHSMSGTDASKKMSHEERRQKMLEKYDTDGDGKLSEEEKREIFKERMRKKREHMNQDKKRNRE